MTDIPGMIIWTGDYLADTGHLTTFEHGAYFLLLQAMWRNGGKLAKDGKKLALLAKMSNFHWLRIEKTIMDFMTLIEEPDGSLWITQKRLQQELNLAQARNSKRVSSGRLGGIAKAMKNKNIPTSNASSNDSGNGISTPYNSNSNSNYKKDSFNGLGQESGSGSVAGSSWVPTKRVLGKVYKAGERAPAYEGQPFSLWKILMPEDCQ